MSDPQISVITPTLNRPAEVGEMLRNLSCQTVRPLELILVDGAPLGVVETQRVVSQFKDLPFEIYYLRKGGGTAIQRNVGIDRARGKFIAFVDDDVRLEPDFFARMMEAFEQDTEQRIGGISGYDGPEDSC